MDLLEFYIGELEEALDPVESQLRLSGQVEIPRLRALVEAARKVIEAFDDETDEEEANDDTEPFDLHDKKENEK